MVLAASVAEDFFRAVLQGTPPGAVYALIALGFVLTYKTSGVFNLAFGAQAFVSAGMYYKTRIEWEWPVLPSLILSVFVLAPAIGLLLERLIFRNLRTASSISKLVVSIGLTVALPELFKEIAGFQAVAGSTPQGIVPDGARVYYDPFGVYPWSRNELAQMAVGLAGMVLLGALFRFTPLGLRMRAVVESPRMTELNGIHADRVSAFAWALSSTFAGMAGVLIAPRFNTLVAPDFFNLTVVAIAAAAVGRLVSLPRAVYGGLGLGILIAVFNTYLPRWSDDYSWLKPIQANLTPSMPFVVLFGILVFWPAIRRSRDAADPLAGVDPPPPALAAIVRSPELTRMTRTFAVVSLGFFAWLAFFVVEDKWVFHFTTAVIMSIIFCSIVVFTGLAGQISLCQASFAAIGGFTVFQMVDRWDTPVLVAAVVGALIAAVVGALLSLPVLRLGGVWLAIATLAFAFFFDSVMLKFSWVGGGDTALLQGTRVPRPQIGGIDFLAPRSWLILCLIVLVIVGVLVINVREGTVGRSLRALRGSEVAAQSVGISPAKGRIIAFALSAALAGLGGALLSAHRQNVDYATNFTPFVGLFWLVIVVTIGPRTVEGAIQAGVGFVLFEEFVLRTFIPWITDLLPLVPEWHPAGGWRFILFGLSAIQYSKHPEGLLEYGKRRSLAKQQARIDRRRARKDGTAAPEPRVPEAVAP
jgi:branched-chain amino acid transport system permease protein